MGAFGIDELKNLIPGLRSNITEEVLYRSTIQLREKIKEVPALDALSYLYLKQYIADQVLVKVDRASMLCGLEVRAPLLDFRLVELLYRLPAAFKFRRFSTKYLLKKLMAPKIGRDVAYRRKKGFSVPIARWLRGQARPLALELLSTSSTRETGFLNSSAIEQLLQEHLDGRADHRKKLWSLMVFMLWYRTWGRT